MKSKPNLSSINIDAALNQSSMEDAIQGYKQAIESFGEIEGNQLPDQLEQFLLHVAKTGDTLSTWDKVQKVLVQKLKLVLDEFYESHPYKAGKINSNYENDTYQEMKERLVQLLNKFESAPFTIQRLCELITNPMKNYTKCEKYMRALEKNLMVVTSWHYPSRRSAEPVEQMNGGFDSRTSLTSIERPRVPLPPSPVATSAPVIPVIIATGEAAVSENGKQESNQSIADDSELPNSAEATTDTTRATPHSNTTPEVVEESSKTDLADQDVLPEVGTKELSVDITAMQSSDASPNERLMKMTGDISTVPLTNTEKDALKEPLPGVGTLVEKHSVKSSPIEVRISTPDTSQLNSQLSEEKRVAQSPKRKSIDEDMIVQVESPTKRLKTDNGDVFMTSTEDNEA